MARIAEVRKEDPTMGTVAEKSGGSGGGNALRMPPKTRKALSALSKVFKEAKRLDETAVKGAALDGTAAAAKVAGGAGR
jgi:hypothetical protein